MSCQQTHAAIDVVTDAAGRYDTIGQPCGQHTANGKTEPLMGADMSSRGYARIDAENLMAEMDIKDFQLINVHIPYGGEIPGTDADIAYNRVEDITAMYPDKEQTLVLYCRSGSMSAAASAELTSLGYKNIIELKGGYNAWQRAGGEMMMR